MKKRVIAVVDDLFFAAKIKGTAAQVDVEVSFQKNAEKLFEAAKAGDVSSIIFDLQATSLDPFACAQALKADESTRQLPLIGFYSHVNTDLQKRAKEAGIEHVLPRSVFNQRLMEILKGRDG